MASDPIVESLSRERAAFIDAFERVPETSRMVRPDASRWSAVDVVEHIARMDRGLCRIVAHHAKKPLSATPDELAAGALTPRRVNALRDRSAKVEAPEPVRPAGELAADAALAELGNSHVALLECYAAADPQLLDGAMHPHPFLGMLTLRAWFELVGHHDARHAQQLDELAGHFRAQEGGAA